MKSTIRGMFMLGRGKREGIHEFSNTSDSLLSALAPWIALAIVSCGTVSVVFPYLFKVHKISFIYLGISYLLYQLCCFLLLVVMIHSCAKYWNGEENWKRTATAYFWCSWVPILDFLLFFLVVSFVLSGLPNILTALLAVAFILYMVYGIWLNWFVIKCGLQISTQRAIFVIIIVHVPLFILNSIFFEYNNTYIIQMTQELKQYIELVKSAQ